MTFEMIKFFVKKLHEQQIIWMILAKVSFIN